MQNNVNVFITVHLNSIYIQLLIAAIFTCHVWLSCVCIIRVASQMLFRLIQVLDFLVNFIIHKILG